MTVEQSKIAQSILTHIPAFEHGSFVHDLSNDLDADSDDLSFSLVAALLQQCPDRAREQAFIGRLASRVENGHIEPVAELCTRHGNIEEHLILSLSSSIAQFSKSLVFDRKTGLVAPAEVHKSVPVGEDDVVLPASQHSTKATIYQLKLLQRLKINAAPAEILSQLFDTCLILLGASDHSLTQTSRDTLAVIISTQQMTFQQCEALWTCIQTQLSRKDQFAQTIACSIWSRWVSLGQQNLFPLMEQSLYWRLLVDGLRLGDAERRKNLLHIMRGSIELAVQSDTCVALLVSPTQSSCSSDVVRDHYLRYCTVFETIILGRYLNQVQDCEPNLAFLCSAKSAVQPVWLYTLLTSAMDNKMQVAIRKYIGNWIFDATLPIDQSADFSSFFSDAFLPWALQGHHFTSTLVRQERSLKSTHGDHLIDFVTKLLTGEVEIAVIVLDSIIFNIQSRKNNNFAYALVYLIEGIGRAVESNKHSIIRGTQFLKLEEMVGWIGLPEVARDHVLARFWRICHLEIKRNPDVTGNESLRQGAELWDRLQTKSAALGSHPSADEDGVIALSRFSLSKREIKEGETKKKCDDLLIALSVNAGEKLSYKELQDRIDDIWSDMEYLEYPKGLLITVTKTLVHQDVILALNEEKSTEYAAVSPPELLEKLRDLATTRSYLFPYLVDGVRRIALQPQIDATKFGLEDIIMGMCRHPPSATVDARLEDASTALITGISDELSKYNYNFYFGQREGYGFAALLDMVARLSSPQPVLMRSIMQRILSRWKAQKNPPPAVSPWKKVLHLQTLVLCVEQHAPKIDSVEAEALLRNLLFLVALEPLPRYRYIFEWMITRVFMIHPSLQHVLFAELDTKDHHSNPKYLSSLMKIGVRLAKLDTADEEFSRRLAITFVPLSASAKVIIRHEAQWQVPILIDHARTKNWSSIAGTTAFEALDEYIRSLQRYGDPPLERQVDLFDPTTDNNMTHLIEGRWNELDQNERIYSTHADLEALYRADADINAKLPPSCLPIGPPITRPQSSDPIPLPTNETTPEPTTEPTLATALQTKGTAYLSSAPTRFPHLHVIASLVDNPYNLGGLSRVSEIFGASALHMASTNVTSSRDFTGVSVSSHLHVPICGLPLEKVAEFLKERRTVLGYSVVGIEQTDRSVRIGEAACVLPEKCVLVLGSEAKGIPAALLAECDMLVEIPQVGVTRSLNVQTAAAIVLCEYAKQHRK